MSKEADLYIGGMSIPQVSEACGIARSTLRFRFKKLGILRTRVDGVRIAALEGRLSKNKGVKKVFSDEWKQNISNAKLGVGRGTSKKPNGYIEYTMGEHKGRSVHVVLMEREIGRRLLKSECVHHKNGIRDDNRIENLEVMTRAEHARLHALENIDNRQRCDKGKFL